MAKVDWLGPMRPPIDHCPNIPPLLWQDRREVGPPAQDILSARRVERRSGLHQGSDIPGSPDLRLLRLLNGGFDGNGPEVSPIADWHFSDVRMDRLLQRSFL